MKRFDPSQGRNRDRNYRRQRAEWPYLDQVLLNRIRQEIIKPQSPQAQDAVKALVQGAGSACNSYSPYIDDGNVFSELQLPNPDYDSLLKVLYWRSRQQVAVWELFCLLCKKGFLDCEVSLGEPIDFSESTEEINTVARYLGCFDSVIRQRQMSPIPFKNWQNWEAPLDWLAIAIARGCTEHSKLFELIQFTGILGRFHTVKLNNFMNSNLPKHFRCDPQAAAGNYFPYYGFWLPHGIGHDWDKFEDRIAKCLQKSTTIEVTYKRYFEISDAELRVVSYAKPTN